MDCQPLSIMFLASKSRNLEAKTLKLSFEFNKVCNVIKNYLSKPVFQYLARVSYF